MFEQQRWGRAGRMIPCFFFLKGRMIPRRPWCDRRRRPTEKSDMAGLAARPTRGAHTSAPAEILLTMRRCHRPLSPSACPRCRECPHVHLPPVRSVLLLAAASAVVRCCCAVLLLPTATAPMPPRHRWLPEPEKMKEDVGFKIFKILIQYF